MHALGVVCAFSAMRFRRAESARCTRCRVNASQRARGVGEGGRRRSILATAGALAVAKKAWLAAANGLLAATCALSVVMHSLLIATSGLMAVATAMVSRAGDGGGRGKGSANVHCAS